MERMGAATVVSLLLRINFSFSDMITPFVSAGDVARERGGPGREMVSFVRAGEVARDAGTAGREVAVLDGLTSDFTVVAGEAALARSVVAVSFRCCLSCFSVTAGDTALGHSFDVVFPVGRTSSLAEGAGDLLPGLTSSLVVNAGEAALTRSVDGVAARTGVVDLDTALLGSDTWITISSNAVGDLVRSTAWGEEEGGVGVAVGVGVAAFLRLGFLLGLAVAPPAAVDDDGGAGNSCKATPEVIFNDIR